MTTPAIHVKKFGLIGVAQMSRISGKSVSTLRDWFKNDRQAFDTMLLGCVMLTKSPYALWLKPEALRATKYTGPAVAINHNDTSFAVLVTADGYFHNNSGRPLDGQDIVAVMAYRE